MSRTWPRSARSRRAYAPEHATIPAPRAPRPEARAVDCYRLVVVAEGIEFTVRHRYDTKAAAMADAVRLVAAGWVRAVIRDGGEDLLVIHPTTAGRS